MDKRHLITGTDTDGKFWMKHISHAEWLAYVLAAYDREGFRGIVHATQGSHDTDVWAWAMTAHYGPVGMHECYTGPDGRPTAEGLAFPRVRQDMAEARRMLSNALGRDFDAADRAVA